MQLSPFEKEVLGAIIEGDPEERTLQAQLLVATVDNRDYTGIGLYTKLSVAPGAPRLERSTRYIEETPKVHLAHPQLPAGAGAILWFSEGWIDTLECYAYDGEWPKNEAEFVVSR